MTKILPVSKETCANKCWQPNPGYGFTSGQQFASLVGAELAVAIQAFPIVFIRRDNTFTLAGLLSFEPNDNLFVAPDGKWLGPYIPACFRSYPFRLAKAETGAIMLCVDEESGLIHESQGNPFFDAEGNLSSSTKQVAEFMHQVWNNAVATQHAVQVLDQAGLIEPWPLVVNVNQEEKRVDGVFRFNEARLNSFDDQAFLTLRKYLPIAYAQLFSIVNVGDLVRLNQARAEMQVPTQPVNLDLDKIFGKDDDLIRFSDI